MSVLQGAVELRRTLGSVAADGFRARETRTSAWGSSRTVVAQHSGILDRVKRNLMAGGVAVALSPLLVPQEIDGLIKATAEEDLHATLVRVVNSHVFKPADINLRIQLAIDPME